MGRSNSHNMQDSIYTPHIYESDCKNYKPFLKDLLSKSLMSLVAANLCLAPMAEAQVYRNGINTEITASKTNIHSIALSKNEMHDLFGGKDVVTKTDINDSTTYRNTTYHNAHLVIHRETINRVSTGIKSLTNNHHIGTLFIDSTTKIGTITNNNKIDRLLSWAESINTINLSANSVGAEVDLTDTKFTTTLNALVGINRIIVTSNNNEVKLTNLNLGGGVNTIENTKRQSKNSYITTTTITGGVNTINNNPNATMTTIINNTTNTTITNKGNINDLKNNGQIVSLNLEGGKLTATNSSNI